MTAEEEDPLEAVVRRRLKQACAAVLAVNDRIAAIAPELADELRRVALREINDLADLSIHLLRATDSSGVNELFIRQVAEIHSAVVRR